MLKNLKEKNNVNTIEDVFLTVEVKLNENDKLLLKKV